VNRLIGLLVITAAFAGCTNHDDGTNDLATSADLARSDLASPDLATQDLASSDLTSSDLAEPDLAEPDLAMPDLAMPDLAMPDLTMADLTMTDQAMPDLASACVINGTVYPAGAVNPATSCQSCQPATSTTSWTNAPAGTSCDTGRVCATNGTCVVRCYIGGIFYAQGAKNPQNDCQECQPDTSTSTWTDIADNTACNGGICRSATCTPGCYIAGTFYEPGTVNPSAPCQNCQPNESTSAWTVGTMCGGRCVYTQSDVSNCGACGRSCGTCGGTTCQHSECTPTTVGTGNPFSIALDATYVYWTNAFFGSTGNISRAPLVGGATTLVASGLGSAGVGPFGLAVDATHAYWTINNTNSPVMRVALSGGTPATLASGQSYPQYMAIDSTNVYFTTLGPNANPSLGSLMRVPLAGGTPTTLTSVDTPGDVLVAGGSIYWISGGTNGNSGRILRMPTSGGTPTTLISGLLQAARLAVDATSVYVTNPGAGTVLRVPIGGGTPTTLVSGMPAVFGIAVDATNAYFTNVFNSPAGTVMRVPIGGGTPTPLASGLGAPRNIAVNASCVYFTSTGRVMKVAK
jgi:hypothetical protein